jgi:hypothetical protein
MSRNQYLLRYVWCSCDLWSRCYMWFPCISTKFLTLLHTEMPTLSKIHGFAWLARQALSIHCCNTSKSLSGTEYTKVCRCPHSQKSRGLRSGDNAGQLTGRPWFIHCSPKVQFRCCLAVQRKWDGALSCMNHMCCYWWRGTCSKSTGKSFTKKWWYTAPVSLLGKRAGLTVDHLQDGTWNDPVFNLLIKSWFQLQYYKLTYKKKDHCMEIYPLWIKCSIW